MARNLNAMAKTIISGVGGKENISSVTHCITRLRFILKDNSQAQTETVSGIEGVIKVIEAGGQYQVVVGNIVDDLYDVVLSQTGLGANSVQEDDAPSIDDVKKVGLFGRLLDVMSGVLAPTLGVLAAAGIIKGLTALALTLGWIGSTSGTYMLLYAIGDGFYYFLPIILGFTAARKFKSNEIIGAAVGAALVYPAMVNIGTLPVIGIILGGTPFAMNFYNRFFGIPIIMPGTGYTSSVVPIIIAVWFASKLEKALRKRLPAALKGILTPVITLLVTVALTYLIIGPVSMALCGCISTFVTFLYRIPVIGGIIAGALIGGGFGVLVMFGLHWVLISLGLSTIALQGFDYMLACGSIGPMIGMAQGIAICIAAKIHHDDKVFDLALPSTLSQICDVGEPLMYSILIPIKKYFYLNILGGCVGGAVIGLLQTKLYLFGGSGLFSFPNFISPESGFTDLVKYAIGVAVGCVFVFVTQLIIYRKDDAKVFDK